MGIDKKLNEKELDFKTFMYSNKYLLYWFYNLHGIISLIGLTDIESCERMNNSRSFDLKVLAQMVKACYESYKETTWNNLSYKGDLLVVTLNDIYITAYENLSEQAKELWRLDLNIDHKRTN